MDAKITVKSRDVQGSASARRLRRDGWVPGVIYSDGTAARTISLPKHEFEQMLRHHTSEHVMIKIQVDGGKEESVLLKDVQHDALSDGVVHVDLQKVAMDKKLHLEVPVELIGEAEGVKNQGGVIASMTVALFSGKGTEIPMLRLISRAFFSNTSKTTPSIGLLFP